MVGTKWFVSNRSDGAGQLVMVQTILIGIGAGAAGALLFASIASGSLLSIALFYLAPLPIMIAALGWTHWAAAIAALTAAAALATIFGGVFSLAFLVGVGLPAWWLGYLAMLARPVAATAGAPALEWYPPGRLVLWAAVLAAAAVTLATLNFGTDFDAYRASLNSALDRLIRVQNDDGSIRPPGGRGPLLDFLVLAIPPVAAVLTTITHLLNLWVAARTVKFSGLLKRPWPDLPSLTLPPLSIAALGAAVLVSLFGGLPGIIATGAASALLMAYAVLGFAVLHTLTRGMKARSFVLAGAYVAVAVFGWPVLALCLLGLGETAFRLRARLGHQHAPPTST
jgi:hypothetical protein